jgi:hypothetical protein
MFRSEFESADLSYVSLCILLNGFALSRSIVAVATVTVCDEDASEAEEGEREFHGQGVTGWIGRCFGGTGFPHQLILWTQHPSTRRAQSWELAALLVIPGFFWRLKSLLFCSPRNGGNPATWNSGSIFLSVYRPHR